METRKEVVFSEVIEVNETARSDDVRSDGSFKSLLLAQSTQENLHRHGFKKPSPVQMKAIPPGMAGLDMLVQAKSGTGKTLVFAILAVENVKLSSKTVQKLVIAPTREIAIQIGDTIQKLAPKGTRIAVLTGGTSVYEDKEKLKKGIHIAVGTTGRLCQLVNENSLSLGSLSLFVLDEADKMMSSAFEKDVNFLYSCVASMRQVAVFSATYPPNLAASLIPFLRSPIHIRLNADDVQLIGVKQYVSICCGSDPVDVAITAFASIQFKQSFLFCNKAEECPLVVERLVEKGIEAAAISALLEQSQREDVIKRFKSNKIKVLVSTDLTARGVDADNVDLVINMDNPADVETYFHRIGRAARFGGQGASLTILSTKKSLSMFANFVVNGGIRAKTVHMDAITPTLTTDCTFFDACALFVPDDGKRTKGKDENIENRDDTENEDPIEVRSTGYGVGERESMPDYSDQLDKAMILSTSLKRNEVMDKSEEIVMKEEKKKFRFVPSRAKKSPKYYMRGEMISIRNSLTSDEWKEYAIEKFDLTKEPFVLEEGAKNDSEEQKNRKWERGKIVEGSNQSDIPSSHRDTIKEYTKKDLIAICKSKPSKVWKSYAETRWNLADDPFVVDQSMRCSFTQRIRLQRQREKVQRDKVVAERNAARIRLISIGTTVFPMKEWDGSFDEYCIHMKMEMSRTKGGQRRGPVVNRRREKEEYTHKVEETKKILERTERNYEYTLNMALKLIKEGGIETDMDEGWTADDTIYGISKEEEEEEVLGLLESSNEDEKNDVKELEDEYEEEEESGVDEEEREEGADDDEGKNDEGGTWEIGNDEYENGLDMNKQDACSRFYSSYNMNIEFARVFHAYLVSMSTIR